MTDNEPLAAVLDEAYEALYDDRFDACRAALNQARRIAGGAPEVRLLEVDLLEAEGQADEAVTACEEALEAHPTDMTTALRLATLLLDIYEDIPAARPHLETLVTRLQKGEKPAADADDETTADFHLEVLLTLTDCRSADHDPRGALQAADAAVALAKDDAMARVARASALFDLCQLEEAEKAVAQAVDRDPRCADAYWLRGRLLTSKGDDVGADRAFTRACQLDPERFQMPHRVEQAAFEALMRASIDDLPAPVAKYLKNVAITVEDLPDMATLTASDPPLSPGSLGLYEGTPPSLAPRDDPWSHFPSRITLFKKNIEVSARSEEELRDLVGTTLLHEVGHYLGLDEDDLDARGLG